MRNLNQVEESSLDLRLKKNLLEFSQILGCRLSEFEVVATCKKPTCLESYWVDLAWESDKNLRLHLAFNKHQAYLKQTFKNTQVHFPVRWGNGLTPVLQFSPDGICPITQQEARQLVQQFSQLPALPLTEKSWGEMSLKILEPLFMPGFAAADKEESWIALGLETPRPAKKYEKREQGMILRCRFISNEWVVDFSSQKQLADNQVKLMLIDNVNTEILKETQKLVHEDERWRFRYVLPQAIVSKVADITVIPFSSE